MPLEGRDRLRHLARIGWLGARDLLRALTAEDVRLRALALTTITLFALVPALVVAFTFLQAFAGTDAIWKRTQDFLIENLAVGARASIEPYLERFLRNAHATRAGLVSGAFLVASAVKLVGNVERALNEQWAVHRGRSLVQKALMYWGSLTLGPILLAGSLTLAHQVRAVSPAAGQLARAGSLGLTVLFFTVIYLIVPFTKVRLGAALAGGAIAGVVWELAKGLYTWAVAHFVGYHAIYGSVAAIPIFMLWLYISWTVLLFGARVAFVVQYSRQLVRAREPDKTPLGRELLTARALLEVARAFRDGRAPPEPGEVAAAMDVLPEPVREALAQLRASGMIQEVAGGGLVPARPLDQLTLADVRRELAGRPPEAGTEPADALVAGVLAGAEGQATASLAGVSFADLCRRLDGLAPREPGAARN